MPQPANKLKMIFACNKDQAIGDWILTLPAVALVRQKWPGLDCVTFCPRGAVSLAEWSGLFARVYAWEPDWYLHYPGELDHCVAALALNQHDMQEADRVAYALGRAGVRLPIVRIRYNDADHYAKIMIDQLAPLGIAQPEQLPAPLACWSYAGSRLVALHAGCGYLWPAAAKTWPYYPDLIRQLKLASYRPVQIVGPDDAPLDLVEQVRLPLGQLADFLLRCDAFIGNDSAPAHLAGALGLPTVTIFGLMDPAQWHPVGPRVTWLRADDGIVAHVDVDLVKHELLGRLAHYGGASNGRTGTGHAAA